MREIKRDANMNSRPPWKAISGLLTLLGAGILAAALFAGFMLYRYGPTGRYPLGNVLLAPKTLGALSLTDPDDSAVKNSKGKGSRLVFDRIEYVYWDKPQRLWHNVKVDWDNYQRFYDSIESEISILEPSKDIVKYFAAETPSRLMIMVKHEAANKQEPYITPLQVVEFAPGGDYYRVQLREHGSTTEWAYFHHAGIAEQASKLLIGSQP